MVDGSMGVSVDNDVHVRELLDHAFFKTRWASPSVCKPDSTACQFDDPDRREKIPDAWRVHVPVHAVKRLMIQELDDLHGHHISGVENSIHIAQIFLVDPAKQRCNAMQVSIR
jgi:hypothetical protein